MEANERATYVPEGRIPHLRGAEQTLVDATDRIREIDEEVYQLRVQRQDYEKVVARAKEELMTKLEVADAAVAANWG